MTSISPYLRVNARALFDPRSLSTDPDTKRPKRSQGRAHSRLPRHADGSRRHSRKEYRRDQKKSGSSK
jgi:hypothetical protein